MCNKCSLTIGRPTDRSIYRSIRLLPATSELLRRWHDERIREPETVVGKTALALSAQTLKSMLRVVRRIVLIAMSDEIAQLLLSLFVFDAMRCDDDEKVKEVGRRGFRFEFDVAKTG